MELIKEITKILKELEIETHEQIRLTETYDYQELKQNILQEYNLSHIGI